MYFLGNPDLQTNARITLNTYFCFYCPKLAAHTGSTIYKKVTHYVVNIISTPVADIVLYRLSKYKIAR